MTARLERLEAQTNDARKQLDKAIGKRDDAIKALIKSDAQIAKAQRALARVSKRRIAAKQEARRAKQTAAPAHSEPIPAL